MPPLDDTPQPGSKTLDHALSLVAAFIVVAIIVVARYSSGNVRVKLRSGAQLGNPLSPQEPIWSGGNVRSEKC